MSDAVADVPDGESAPPTTMPPAAPSESGGHGDDGGGHGHRLTYMIVAAIVLAIVSALVIPSVVGSDAALSFFQAIGLGGEVFLRALTMMVVPLVVASVMSGIMGMGDVRKLGRPGFSAILYYVSTTILAVLVGLVVVYVIQPGTRVETPQARFARLDTDKNGAVSLEEFSAEYGADQDQNADKDFVAKDSSRDGSLTLEEFQGLSGAISAEDRQTMVSSMAQESGLAESKIQEMFPQLSDQADGEHGDTGRGLGTIFSNLVLMLFTDNLFEAAVDTQLLPLIVFSIIFAGMLTTMGRRVDTIAEIIEESNTALMSFVMLLMNIAPIGIFCLVASRFGEAQARGEFLDTISQTGWFVLTVLVGLGVHLFGTLPLIYWIFKRQSPYVFMRQMSQALLTAFSTASSSATLPVTMKSATERGGVSKRSVDFVVPLGATINMDGTALYEAAAAIFIAQVYEQVDPEFELTMAKMVVIAVTATLAAIGAAGIPEAGLVTMMIVLNAVGLPLHYVSLILAVDWLLDRFRTATNTFGDAVGAAIVDETFVDD